MKRVLIVVFCAIMLLALAACAAPVTTEQATPSPSEEPVVVEETIKPSPSPSDVERTLVYESIESEAIVGNLLETPSKLRLVVYLPPSYYESEKNYPVVYYLHGHGEGVGGYINSGRYALDNAFEGGASEFIFVELEGGVSYYVNSSVTGNWEDYILEEVIPFIDQKYRTLRDATSRGICGFSMGGFGALNLAMRHPDVFSAVYGMSPGLLAEDGFEEAMNSWRRDGSFLTDYSRAFAPDTSSKTLGRIPAMDGSDEDNVVIELWESGFGNLKEKIEAYLALGQRLKGIGISCGENDAYSWIPKGVERFTELLTENAIEHTLFTFSGGHTPPPNSAAEHLVPFFNEHLAYE